jgi:hypothetical protein
MEIFMRHSFLKAIFSIASLYSLAALPARAVSPDPRILSLVSPRTQILSGMRATQSKPLPNSLLMITSKSKLDLEDFIAVSGVDSLRSIHEVLLESTPGDRSPLITHSLLASGRFDRERIYRSAISNGAALGAYRGIDLVVLEPFPRERQELDEVRWLAILDGDVALFGMIPDVEAELDRYLSRSSAETIFATRLARLKKDDENWSMLLASGGDAQTPDALKLIRPTLPGFIPLGGTLEFGFHFTSSIELDYDVSVSSEAGVQTAVQTLPGSISSSFLATSACSPSDSSAHGAIKISREQYVAWLAEVAARKEARKGSGNG